MNERYGVQFKTDIKRYDGEPIFEIKMFGNICGKTSKEQAIEYFDSIKDTKEAYLICNYDVIVDASNELKNCKSEDVYKIKGVYGDVCVRGLDNNLNYYNLDIYDLDSHKSNNSSSYGLPSQIDEDKYFKIALIKNLEEINKSIKELYSNKY